MTQSAFSAQGPATSNRGVITSVRGSVVDVRFDDSSTAADLTKVIGVSSSATASYSHACALR